MGKQTAQAKEIYFCLKNDVSEAILNTSKRIMQRQPSVTACN